MSATTTTTSISGLPGPPTPFGGVVNLDHMAGAGEFGSLRFTRHSRRSGESTHRDGPSPHQTGTCIGRFPRCRFPMSQHPEPNPALLTWLVLGRVHRGGVRKIGNRYLDHQRRVPAYLVETVTELVAAGLLAISAPGSRTEATQQITLTEAGRTRYAALCRQQRADLSATDSPVCRRLGGSETTALPDDRQLRWARCPADGRLHAFQPAGTANAAGHDHVEAICGYRPATTDLALQDDSSGALCLGCVVDVASGGPGPGPTDCNAQ